MKKVICKKCGTENPAGFYSAKTVAPLLCFTGLGIMICAVYNKI